MLEMHMQVGHRLSSRRHFFFSLFPAIVVHIDHVKSYFLLRLSCWPSGVIYIVVSQLIHLCSEIMVVMLEIALCNIRKWLSFSSVVAGFFLGGLGGCQVEN